VGSRVGHIPAMVKLSEVYATGSGTPVDTTESVRYLKMAADAGDGDGVKVDTDLHECFGLGRL
jgi:TPR repeat protein